MNDSVSCPVCGPVHGGKVRVFKTARDSSGFECDVCGKYEISGSAYAVWPALGGRELTPVQRAVISHRLATASRDQSIPMITTDWLGRITEDARLPNPLEQASNIIRYVGDEVLQTLLSG